MRRRRGRGRESRAAMSPQSQKARREHYVGPSDGRSTHPRILLVAEVMWVHCTENWEARRPLRQQGKGWDQTQDNIEGPTSVWPWIYQPSIPWKVASNHKANLHEPELLCAGLPCPRLLRRQVPAGRALSTLHPVAESWGIPELSLTTTPAPPSLP